MGLWEKSLRIFKCLCEHGSQSVRRLAHQTGFSKSSVHRLTQARERRNRYPESWFWETADGRQWLRRLVVTTLYTFGLKRGVGLDTLSEFCTRLHLEMQVGCSPSALRGVMPTVETTRLEIAGAWEQEACAGAEVREIIGAVDETFLEQMMLVLMDLRTGYVLLEDVAEDRTYTTWKTRVEARLTALGTTVRSLVSDRAKALIQLAEHGLGCLSMPDFFHCMHDRVKGSALSLARHVRHAHQELTKAEEVLRKSRGRAGRPQGDAEAQHQVEVKRAAVQRWEGVQHAYRPHLETLSLTLHPFHLQDASPQTSVQSQSRLHAEIAALETLARDHQCPVRHDMLKKVYHQVPALAARVDFWWAGVDQDWAQAAISAPWRQWARELLLPWGYWEPQVAHTRCVRRKAKLQRVRAEVRSAFDQHVITQRLAPQGLAKWKAWATEQVTAFQRASSAVEGRNGALAQLHHNQRGLPTQRSKVWTVLHNFDCYAPDGTTPAARFFRRTFPDLFDTVFSRRDVLPQPRRRKHQGALSH